MSVKTELNNLKNEDIYSLIMFALYECRKTSEYSSLSQLSYILDEKNLLNLCEYFGGETIYIPKIEELETLIYSLSAYKSTHIDKTSIDDCFDRFAFMGLDVDAIKELYLIICEVLSKYQFKHEDTI